MTKTILIVGLGIEALMTAFYMQQAGLRVRIIAKNPDPRIDNNVEIQSGSTWRGQGTRYVTLFEGQPYLQGEGYTDIMYPEMRDAFEKPLSEGGWLGKYKQQYTPEERLWLAKRNMSNEDTKTIKDTFDFYVDMNRMAMNEWYSLQITHPQLFINTNVQNDVVRVYDRQDLYNFTKEAHKKNGVLLDTAEGDEIAIKYPHLAESYKGGFIRGGVLKVKGFSIDAHQFCMNMLNYLEEMGANINFNTEAVRISRNYDEVTSILTADEQRLEADYYSLHMGAYDTQWMLENTPARDTIAGVAGGWIIMPRPEGMDNSLKIHGDKSIQDGQPRPAIDQNHAVCGNDIIIGGGYLFTGFSPENINPKQKTLLASENRRVTKSLFPTSFREASELGRLREPNIYCTRNFTFNDIPRMDKLKSTSGGWLNISGGSNTGTFTACPTVAKMLVHQAEPSLHQDVAHLLAQHQRVTEQSEAFLKSREGQIDDHACSYR